MGKRQEYYNYYQKISIVCLASFQAVLVMAFVAGVGWRQQGWDENNPVSGMLANLWIILQPLLFGLIGTEIRVSLRVN